MSHHPRGRVPHCTGGYAEEGRDAPTTMCWEQNLDLSPAPPSPAGRIWSPMVSGGNCLFIAKLHSFRSQLWAITPVSEGQRGDFPCLNSDGYGVVVLVQTYGCLSCQQHFSLWGDFPPRGRCSAWRHSGCYNWAGGCFWPLACSCQGCGKTSYHAQHSPHHRELCGPECHRPCSGPLPS